MSNQDGVSEDEQYSPQDIDSQLYQESQELNLSKAANDVDYDNGFETTAAKKRKAIKVSRSQVGESGIADEDLSELEDDPKPSKKGKKKATGNSEKAPKKSARKRRHDLEDEADAAAIQLQTRMADAHNADVDEYQKGRPGLHRFNLLPDVISVMSKAYNQNSLLEVGILQEVRLFLEPLPDGTLPIINIQRELLLVLAQMPVTIEMLRTSYIGRVVKFYAVCERITQEVRKLADQLMSRWTNMVNRQSQAVNNRRIGMGPPKMQHDIQSEKGKQPDVQKRILSTMTKLKLSNRKR